VRLFFFSSTFRAEIYPPWFFTAVATGDAKKRWNVYPVMVGLLVVALLGISDNSILDVTARLYMAFFIGEAVALLKHSTKVSPLIIVLII
jgi:hypothetical protein